MRDDSWLRQAVQEEIDQRFKGNRTAAARSWGLKQSGLQQFLAGDQGAGLKLIRALGPHIPDVVSEYLGIPGSARAELPQLEEAERALSGTLSPRTQAFGRALASHWLVDQSFGFWAELLHAHNSAHRGVDLPEPSVKSSAVRVKRPAEEAS